MIYGALCIESVRSSSKHVSQYSKVVLDLEYQQQTSNVPTSDRHIITANSKMSPIERHIFLLLLSAVCKTSILKDCSVGYFCDKHPVPSDTSLNVTNWGIDIPQVDGRNDRCYGLTINTGVWIQEWSPDILPDEIHHTFDFPSAEGKIYCDKRVINRLNVEAWAWTALDFNDEDQRALAEGTICLYYDITFDSAVKKYTT